MEKIPNSSIYEGFPEEELSSKKELLSNVDFLNENLDLTFSFEEDAAMNLPEVTDDQLETELEKFCILLGKPIQLDKDKINIEIKAILEMSNDNNLYSERKNEVEVYYDDIKEHVNRLQETMSDLKDCYFVGDVHTHPYEQNSFNKRHPCVYSEVDLKGVCDAYEEGILSSNEPYIFGVGGREGKETHYSFYRLIKKNDKYEIIQIFIKN